MKYGEQKWHAFFQPGMERHNQAAGEMFPWLKLRDYLLLDSGDDELTITLTPLDMKTTPVERKSVISYIATQKVLFPDDVNQEESPAYNVLMSDSFKISGQTFRTCVALNNQYGLVSMKSLFWLNTDRDEGQRLTLHRFGKCLGGSQNAVQKADITLKPGRGSIDKVTHKLTRGLNEPFRIEIFLAGITLSHINDEASAKIDSETHVSNPVYSTIDEMQTAAAEASAVNAGAVEKTSKPPAPSRRQSKPANSDFYDNTQKATSL